jgi:predicted Zn-ribbon and HTH transcriptional regulator
MRIVHEGRGGYIELDERKYPIEHVEGGHFSIHYVAGKHPNPEHLAALKQLVLEHPEKWAIEMRAGASPDAGLALGTIRQRIAELLRGEELTAHEISQRAGVSERDVAEHLRHLEHTFERGPERLRTLAPHCIACGFVFEARRKHARPSRCPHCKSERLSPPRFRLMR